VEKGVRLTRYASILGLGFGDCGKGLFTDFLCRQWKTHTVVRFNGGCQAGHNVVLPDGRHHTFSQFGAGSFNSGVKTVLARPVVVHPTALLVENRYLQQVGVHDALDRLIIDARCRINTPFHQAAGRLREWLRGDRAHGSCGVGFGETVRHGLEKPQLILSYGELKDNRYVRDKLELIRRDLLQEFTSAVEMHISNQSTLKIEAAAEMRLLGDEAIAEKWLASLSELLHKVAPAMPEAIASHLQQTGGVLFEGAQGILLDEQKGFHPHTTWSTNHAGAVDAIAAEYAMPEKVHHFGALRTYLTRHGQGPLPTHDTALDRLAEPHNLQDGWQGAFRRGHPDEVLLRYALNAIGTLDGLLVSHLDVFEKWSSGLNWCQAYDIDGKGRVEKWEGTNSDNLAEREKWTHALKGARPLYAPQAIRSQDEWIDRITQITKAPIRFGSHGNTHRDIREFTNH
jgi:adenylosuccinate synthase